MRRILAGLALALGFAGSACADPVNTDTWYEFSFGGVGSALGACSGGGCVALTNPTATDAPAAPWTFTLTSGATLYFQDVFLSVDQFEIFNNAVSLGVTSAPTAGGTCNNDLTCAIGDSRYSRGSFLLGAGSYSITGLQLAGVGGAGAFIVKVPEPGTLALLGLGLAGLATLRRRRA